MESNNDFWPKFTQKTFQVFDFFSFNSKHSVFQIGSPSKVAKKSIYNKVKKKENK